MNPDENSTEPQAPGWWVKTQWHRAYVYRVTGVVTPVLGGFGIAADSPVMMALALVTAVLGIGLAAGNTPAAR